MHHEAEVETLTAKVAMLRRVVERECLALCDRVEKAEQENAHLKCELDDLRRVVRTIVGDVAQGAEWSDTVFGVLSGGASALASLPAAPPRGDPGAFDRWVVATLHTLIGVGASFQSLPPSSPLESDDRLVVRAERSRF